MVAQIKAIRGMNDILPPETYLWQHVEKVIRKVLQNHGYGEIRTPMLEKTELFKRSIGDNTDIVSKEMYTFLDRNQESLTLRPEGTACVVRAALENNLLHNQTQRLWYRGPFFRYERPQKGRYRQFYQCAAEVFGIETPDIDAELIIMSSLILEKLGLIDVVRLEINSLGTPESRGVYRKKLVAYLEKHKQKLDEDSLTRLHTNPLRILDSKNPELKEIIAHAPSLLDHLDEASKQHFDQLQTYLRHVGIEYTINPKLVRGLDYYTRTVFEWVTDKLGAQGTVCAGGRYDGLVAQLGGSETPALGFAMGTERLVLLLQELNKTPPANTPHVYLITDSPETFAAGLKLANYLRHKVHHLKLILHCGGGSIKSQFKKADKSGARFAIVLGEHEIKTRSATLKHLREDIPQQLLYHDELADYFQLYLQKNPSKSGH